MDIYEQLRIAEVPWLWAGLAAYGLATYYAVKPVAVPQFAAASVPTWSSARSHERAVLLWLSVGVGLLTVCLAIRWVRIGHGPFVNLYELLISQLFSLGLIYAIAYWRMPVIRGSASVVMLAMWVLGAWVLSLPPEDVPNPPTYFNEWKWAHVGFGKVFLAFCLIGTGLAGVILLRRWSWFQVRFRFMPADTVLDVVAWRFMLLALAFESLMLIAGAVWAQDAWGRYWAWDALETSAFLNWLALGAAIHARFTYRMPLRLGAVLIIAIFVFAFFTYFGTPFYGEAAHKGVI